MREKKKRKARHAITLLVLGGMAVILLPNVEQTGGTPQESSVQVWVDRGCGGHYREGESVVISFVVTSPASNAVVTISTSAGVNIVNRVVYTANALHSVVSKAECPAGLNVLEVEVSIPSVFFPPDTIPLPISEVHLSGTCYFYVDTCSTQDADGDGYSSPYDCNDANPLIHPGGQEVCDGKDNDCDTLTDEGCSTCSADWDGDSVPECRDCSDEDRTVYPGAAEVCDGKDNDCDGEIDEGCCVCYDDKDGDGYSDCWDCNDTDPSVYPGAPEVCDGKDNDCDGQIDEGSNCDHVEIWVDRKCGSTYQEEQEVRISFIVVSSAPSALVTLTDYPPKSAPSTLLNQKVTTNKMYTISKTASCPEGVESIFITAVVEIQGKSLTLSGECVFYVTGCAIRDYDGDGYTAAAGDCDDSDPSIYPGAPEVCDGKDNNCNGQVDEGLDCNFVEVWMDKECGSTYNDGEEVTISFRIASSASSAVITIIVYPPKGTPQVLAVDRTVTTNKEYTLKEVAHCSGLETVTVTAVVVVEGETLTLAGECGFYVKNCRKPDNDEDGHTAVAAGGDDCNDDDSSVYPGAQEVCDGKDNDCDREIDEITDGDGDGYVGVLCGGDDCDDTDPAVNPGAQEMLDRRDNNCNGQVDEGASAGEVDKDWDGYTLNQDCDDNDYDVHPGAEEICNDGKDNDCNGLVDCEDGDCADTCGKGVGFIFSFLRTHALIVGIVGLVVVIVVAVAVLMAGRLREERRREVSAPEVGERPGTREELLRRLEGKEEEREGGIGKEEEIRFDEDVEELPKKVL